MPPPHHLGCFELFGRSMPTPPPLCEVILLGEDYGLFRRDTFFVSPKKC